ncbi:hypothetical protein HYH03_009316 [Edaphochlamys debaryana]|uniref:Poly(A) RNA polymerase mitochondrial-like central palm domain-containing protein n=1 Tax=Edaphochlamys debaryana TaxID=47281 RepID=A0A835Y0G5_9CHLO|nr:hypothetical protein HYH03_009316 [Edaphochlamys debaryana]|eukprot:KAG2492368.1 hypothetical protein HYH03_009316 [Edaphochlamys debaryana]
MLRRLADRSVLSIFRPTRGLATNSLGDALEAVVKASAPCPKAREKRQALIDRIDSVLKDEFADAQRNQSLKDLRVVPFGSFLYAVTERSDLDLCITGSALKLSARRDSSGGNGADSDGKERQYVLLTRLPKASGNELLRRAARRLEAEPGLVAPGSMVRLLGARVPLLKFRSPQGVDVDLSLGSALGSPLKAWAVAQVAAVHPAFMQLFTLVKVWAKAQCINDGAAHTFNSWCLTLLVMFHLQRTSPPLLPPLHALLHDTPPRPEEPRLLQRGEPPEALLGEVARRVESARQRYGSQPAPPLGPLLLDFTEASGRLLRAALERQPPFDRPRRGLSVFYGDVRDVRPGPLQESMLYVEDPFDATDNPARTFKRTNPAARCPPGTTLAFVTATFERTARLLRAHMHPHAPGQPPPAPGEQRAPSPAPPPSSAPAEAAGVTAAPPPLSSTSGVEQGAGAQPGPTSEAAVTSRSMPASTAPDDTLSGELAAAALDSPAGAAPGAAPRPATAAPGPSSEPGDPAAQLRSRSGAASRCGSGSDSDRASLAALLVHLFGTELLTRLPELSDSLLGAQAASWARAALALGRPASEVHEALLRQLGAADGFESFASFVRRHNIKVFNPEDFATPEEVEDWAQKRAERQRARREERGRSRADPSKRQAEKRTGPVATAEAPASEPSSTQPGPPGPTSKPRQARAGPTAPTTAPRPRPRLIPPAPASRIPQRPTPWEEDWGPDEAPLATAAALGLGQRSGLPGVAAGAGPRPRAVREAAEVMSIMAAAAAAADAMAREEPTSAAGGGAGGATGEASGVLVLKG